MILLIFGIYLFYGCDKIPPYEVDPPSITDYRTKYLGDFNIVSYNEGWIMGQGNSSDTTYYSTTIVLGNSDSTLNIGGIQYHIDTAGVLERITGDPHYYGQGLFSDENHFILNVGEFQLAYNYSHEMHGTRQ